MGAPAYAKRRDKSESDIVDALRGCGVTVVLCHKPYDALLGFCGQTYLCEFKSPDTAYGKRGLNENQKQFKEVWHGSPPLVFYTVDEAVEWANERRREAV